MKVPGRNMFRHTDSPTLTHLQIDGGEIFYCTSCPPTVARHGGPKFGIREILIKKCAVHAKIKGERDEDFERLEKNHWKVDPHKKRFKRTGKSVGRPSDSAR